MVQEAGRLAPAFVRRGESELKPAYGPIKPGCLAQQKSGSGLDMLDRVLCLVFGGNLVLARLRRGGVGSRQSGYAKCEGGG